MSPASMEAGLNVEETPALRKLVTYIARCNPRGLRRLAGRHGYPLQRGDHLVAFAYHFLREQGPSGFDELVREHPDYELIVERATLDGQLGDSGFTGRTTASADWVQQLAYLAVHRRAALISTLNTHGAALPPTASDVAVAHLALAMLQQGHPTLAGALTTLLAPAPWSGFGTTPAAIAPPLHPGWIVAALFLIVLVAALTLRD